MVVPTAASRCSGVDRARDRRARARGRGVEIANATAIGATGDDWTGFLLVPAGLLLWALGAGTLWTSRKPTGRRYLRRTLIGVVGVVAAFELLLPVGVALVATHAPRSVVEPVALGRPHQDVVLSTRDGLRLRGWYVPSENGAAVIAFPGRTSTVPHAKVLARHGYGVLLVDARGRGESDGDPNAFGWGGRPDVDAAVAYLQARPDVEPLRIGGLGLSVGGELLLEAASGNDGLRAVVSDGAGERSVRESILRGPSGWLVLPRDLVLTAAVAVLSGEAPPPSLADVVAEVSPRPLLLVHAGRGGGGEELNPKYFDAAGDPKQIWLIPEAGHTGGLDARPSEYERRIVAFLDRALPPG